HAERKVRQEEGLRTPPRPFALHRLRAGREPEHCALHDRGERRLRRARRRADRAHGARLLPPGQSPATGWRGAGQGRAGNAGGGRTGRRGRKRLMELAPFSLRRIQERLTAGIDGSLLALSLILVALGLATLFSASFEQPARVTTQ